jgi:hypothetical protein
MTLDRTQGLDSPVIDEKPSRETIQDYLGESPNSAETFLKRIYAQREEILAAFIAKYGCQPDEIMQVEVVGGLLTPGSWEVVMRPTDKDEILRGEGLTVEQYNLLRDIALRLRRALAHCMAEIERLDPSESPAKNRAQNLLTETEWLEP